MRKAIAVFMLIALALAGVAAQGKPHMDKGDSAIYAGIDLGNGFGIGGGYELMFHKLTLAETIPLTFGAAAKAGIDFWPGFEIAAAGLANVHFAFSTFSELPDWVQKFELYAGLGLGLGYDNGLGLGLAGGSGVAYQLNDKLAIIADDIYAYHFLGGRSSNIAIIGVRLKM